MPHIIERNFCLYRVSASIHFALVYSVNVSVTGSNFAILPVFVCANQTVPLGSVVIASG